MLKEQHLTDIANDVVREYSEVFLVATNIKGVDSDVKYQVFVDADNGLTIEHCSLINRKMRAKLEEQGEDQSDYALDVSSPGIDFPITLHRQYIKNTGRKIEVFVKGENTTEGILKEVKEKSINLLCGNALKEILFSEIIQSKIKF